jgi:hypothetical protein
VLSKFAHLEAIPSNCDEWHVNVTNVSSLAATLEREIDRARLFRTLATLRSDIELFDNVDQLFWTGPKDNFTTIAERLDARPANTQRRARQRSLGSQIPKPSEDSSNS